MDMLQFVTPILTIWTAGNERDSNQIRPPAVAGQFYPESANVLKLAVEKFLEDALPPQGKNPFAIIVPHAGYIYSGQIAADGLGLDRSFCSEQTTQHPDYTKSHCIRKGVFRPRWEQPS